MAAVQNQATQAEMAILLRQTSLTGLLQFLWDLQPGVGTVFISEATHRHQLPLHVHAFKGCMHCRDSCLAECTSHPTSVQFMQLCLVCSLTAVFPFGCRQSIE